MSMSFTDVLQVYFVMGIVMVGGGAIELQSAGPVSTLLSEGPAAVAVNEQEVRQESGGWLTNIFGPLQEATGEIFGGALIAVSSVVTDLLAFLAWPVSVSAGQNMPTEVQLLASILVFAMVMGTIKVLRPSA